MRFREKVVVITGASRGIGAEIARQFGREGANVIINYRSNGAKAKEVVDEIKSYGRHAIAVQGDVSSSSDMAATFSASGPSDMVVVSKFLFCNVSKSLGGYYYGAQQRLRLSRDPHISTPNSRLYLCMHTSSYYAY